MKSFIKLTMLSMQGHLYYRTSFIINLLSPVILLAGQYLLWAALYAQQEGSVIGGIGREEMFSYILVAFALNNLLGWSTENGLSKEIKSGMVVARCIRPVSFLAQSLSEMLGALVMQGGVNFVIVAAGFLCFGKYMQLPQLVMILRFIPCFLLALLLRMLLVDVFSLICFFSTGYLGISWTRTALFEFFSGAMIPVAMFPGWLKTLAYFTPFPYMLQVPVAVLLGQEIPVKLSAVYGRQALWIGVFLLLHGLIYGGARRNLTIAGG